MTNIIEYEVPNWNEIYVMLLAQAQKVKSDDYKPDIIVGIARGGLVPARILTDLLEIPQLAIIQEEFYVDIAQTRFEPILKQTLTTKIAGKKTLLVDDVADTGKSLELAEKHLLQHGAVEIKTVTLYSKPQTTTTPNYFEEQTSSWVVFPWDTKETLRRIIQKQEGKRTANQEIAKLVKAGLPKHLAEKLLADMK